MIQLVKHLSYQHENTSVETQNPCNKLGTVMHIQNSSKGQTGSRDRWLCTGPEEPAQPTW